MSTAKARSAHALAILGPEVYNKLPSTKVLLVGAGGIGCELLKNIVLTGFGKITLLDLDTIDVSNLNRQFLFRKKDVKQSKALVAAKTAGPFNPNVQITPIHGNIKESQYDIPWFQQFDIVLNALDNLEARRHVNRMCLAAQVPLVESGTAGYLGQVQPLLHNRTECFDCIPKPTPKTFPVCTIRSTPSQPIHCIVWSKSYLLGQLFGEDEDAGNELDEAEQQGENAQEIATLRKEAQAFNSVRSALRSPSLEERKGAAKLAFQKVFNTDIKNLLIMSDMWRNRAPPVPLDFEGIMEGGFVLRANEGRQESGDGVGSSASSASIRAQENGDVQSSGVGAGVLKDQKVLTLQDNVKLFVDSTNRLSSRLASGNETTISFDKDDDDTLDFVTAASNLRSAAYGIATQTRWGIKEMAGNIIPAIATTNAIISGLIVLQALQILRNNYTGLRNVHLQYKPAVPLSTILISKPNPACGVCRDTYTLVRCDPARTLLGDVVKGILGEAGDREVSVYEEKRILSDPDWEDNLERTLESLSVTRGKFLTIADEDGEWATLSVGISELPPNHPADAPPYILPSPLPQPARREKPPVPPTPETPPNNSRKRPLPIDMDSDVIDLAPTPKRHKPMPNGKSTRPPESPSKRRMLETDGLVIMDAPGELVNDVIEID